MAKVMDDATRRRFAGLLPFAPGSFSRWTPDEFADLEEGLRPILLVRNFSPEAMKKYRELSANPEINILDAFRETVSMGDLGGWENLIDYGTGLPVSFSSQAIQSLPNRLIALIFHRCAELNNGPTPEEKTGLESLPPPASVP